MVELVILEVMESLELKSVQSYLESSLFSTPFFPLHRASQESQAQGDLMEQEESLYVIATDHISILPNLCIHICIHRALLDLLVILATQDHVEMWYVLIYIFNYNNNNH